MVDGLLYSADLAYQWSKFAQDNAGVRAEKLISRLYELFTQKEISIIGAYYGANALHALSRALSAQANSELTDPDIVIDDPTIPR
jgi:hypothetical protein